MALPRRARGAASWAALLAASAVCAGAAPVDSHGVVGPVPDGYDVVILSGQSNMVGRDGAFTAAEREPLRTREGHALLAAQPSMPFACRGDVPAAPRFDAVINTTLVPLAAPFFDFLPRRTGCPGLQGAAVHRGLWASFVRAYVVNSLAPGRSVIVVPAAVGSRSISEFDPASPQAQLWARMLVATRAALAYRHPRATRPPANRVAALLWLQGESDGYSKSTGEYAAALRRMVAELRRGVGDESLPFVAGQLLQHIYSAGGLRSHSQLALLRLALGARADAGGGGIPHAALVSSAGLVSLAYHLRDTPRVAGDLELQVHFERHSLEQYGLRFHAALQSLRAAAAAAAGGAGSAASRPPHLRPAHACHWAISLPSSRERPVFPNSVGWDGHGPHMHLFLRGVAPEQWAPAAAALVYDVKLVLWAAPPPAASARGLPLAGPAGELRTGLRVRAASELECACRASAAELLDAEARTGFVRRCGYAIVDRPPGDERDPPGAPNAELSFSRAAHGGASATTFTPYRHNGTFIIPLMRGREGLHPAARPGSVRGATIARGLGGVWLPIHQALGFPDEAARRSAAAAGQEYVVLVRAVAVAPALRADGAVTAERLASAQTLAVRLPRPVGVGVPSGGDHANALRASTVMPRGTRSPRRGTPARARAHGPQSRRRAAPAAPLSGVQSRSPASAASWWALPAAGAAAAVAAIAAIFFGRRECARWGGPPAWVGAGMSDARRAVLAWGAAGMSHGRRAVSQLLLRVRASQGGAGTAPAS